MRTGTRTRVARAVLLLLTIVGLAVAAPSASAGTFPVTNTNDSGPGSLRQAITDADNSSDASNTIPISATGTIGLQSALPQITKSMEIDGPGAASLDFKQSGHFAGIFDIAVGTTVHISDLTVSGGFGGISNLGALTLSDVTVTNNHGQNDGGGIFNDIGARR